MTVQVQRDGLSQPQQFAMSTQIVAKIQASLKERVEAAAGEDAIEADLGTGPQPANV